MARQRRIETQRAKELRGKRRHFAAPGGSHDRVVGFLARVLPMAVGVVAALMVVVPLSPRGEVSFLLDRNKVAMIDERMRIDKALLRGQDNSGRPFSLTADEAVQRSSAEGIVRVQDLVARILLPDGPAILRTNGGAYDISDAMVDATAPVLFTAADGYRMIVRGVSVDLPAKRLVGRGGVSGEIPAGTFRADRLSADLAARTITLEGNARGRLVPGQLRMPR